MNTTTATRNEAAERLHNLLSLQGQEWLDEALVAERYATVERLKLRFRSIATESSDKGVLRLLIDFVEQLLDEEAVA